MSENQTGRPAGRALPVETGELSTFDPQATQVRARRVADEVGAPVVLPPKEILTLPPLDELQPGIPVSEATGQPRRDPQMLVAIAFLYASSVAATCRAVPPRCRFERKSPSGACRRMEATTSSPTTKQRRSAPSASPMNSCTTKLAYRPRRASTTLREAEGFSVSITPAPCAPSFNLITWGGGPSMDSRSEVSSGLSPNTVTGRSMPCAASSWCARSLSRARRMASDGFGL